MAQAATMAPPLSPKEPPRRSGRRSATTQSFSKSPPPHQRPSLSTHNSASTSTRKRPKQEDIDESCLDAAHNGKNPSPVSISNSNTNGRSKRSKQKEKEKSPSPKSTTTHQPPPDEEVPPPDDDDQGITRCVCGNSEDDPDAGEFMVQCERCHVWQHGLCMGFKSEDQLDDDYYCEMCEPNLHTALLKQLTRKSRHPSQPSHNNPHNNSSSNNNNNSRRSTSSRHSRSRSPVVSTKQSSSKRRNTMNSRDAAFDESIKEVIEASAAEAAAVHQDSRSVTSNGNAATEPDDADGPRKKRKRTDEDAPPKKRTRSDSVTSDRPPAAVRDVSSAPSAKAAPLSAPPAPPKTAAVRSRRRGSRKQVAPVESPAPAEGDETPAPAPRRGGNGNRRAGAGSRRGHGNQNQGGAPSEHHTRRGGGGANAANGTNGANAGGGTISTSGAESSRAYKNSHAYVVSQQPLFTSWNLPDYLAHLEHILPSETPKPLEVCAGPSILNNNSSTASGSSTTGTAEMERLTERGVKVKWPSKRMSVGDMNKRVRAILDWVAREQASSSDRCRRREALERAMGVISAPGELLSAGLVNGTGPLTNGILSDMNHLSESPALEKSFADAFPSTTNSDVAARATGAGAASLSHPGSQSSTAKLMEELMEELIQFQERFGPGAAKNRERERR